MNNPRVSVIICAYTMERHKDTLEALDSVRNQTCKPHEVIVAIDHNEELYHRLRAELKGDVKVVLNEGVHGLSETRNVGIRNSSGEIIAFLDDDAIAEKTWLESLVPTFENLNVMAVGGQSIPVWPKGKAPRWFPEEFDFIIGCTAHKKLVLKENGEVRNVTGSNMAFRSEVFERVGLWETELGAIHGKSRGGEEANICLRIRSEIAISMILYQPEALVYHKVIPERTTLRYVFGYCWRDGLAKAKMKNTLSRLGNNSVSEEMIFFRQLLLISVPQRMKGFYKLANITQAGIIMANLSLTGAGYLTGRLRYRQVANE